MAIDFPNNPPVGERHDDPNARNEWAWDGEKWIVDMMAATAVGAQIATPVITDPGVVDPDADVTLDSSDYQILSGIPGDHASSHWQVAEGRTPLTSTNGITAVENIEPAPVEEVRFTLAKTTSTCGSQVSPGWSGPMTHAGGWNYNPDTGNWVCGMIEQMTRSAQGGTTSAIISEDNFATITRITGLPTPWNGESTGPQRFIFYAGGMYYLFYDISCHANGGQCGCNGNMPGPNANAGSGWQIYFSSTPNGPWTDRTPSGPGNGGAAFRGSYGNIVYQSNFERFWRFENGGSASNSTVPGFNTTNNQPRFIWSRNGGSASTTLGPGFAFGVSGTLARNTDATGAFSGWVDIRDNVIAGGWTAGKTISSMGFFNNQYLLVGETGNISRSSDEGLTWTSMDLATETNLSAAWDYSNFITDGNLAYMQGRDGNNYYNCWSTDLTSWIITDLNTDNFQPSAWINGVGWIGFHTRDLGNGNWDLYTETVAIGESPIAQTVLSIDGADADGFEAGMNVENLGGSAATGTISGVDATTVTLAPAGGTWEVITPPQRIRIPPAEFNIIVDSPNDAVNLTELTLTSDLLAAGSDYAARVQYRSDGNVVSNFSDWREFTTS